MRAMWEAIHEAAALATDVVSGEREDGKRWRSEGRTDDDGRGALKSPKASAGKLVGLGANYTDDQSGAHFSVL